MLHTPAAARMLALRTATKLLSYPSSAPRSCHRLTLTKPLTLAAVHEMTLVAPAMTAAPVAGWSSVSPGAAVMANTPGGAGRVSANAASASGAHTTVRAYAAPAPYFDCTLHAHAPVLGTTPTTATEPFATPDTPNVRTGTTAAQPAPLATHAMVTFWPSLRDAPAAGSRSASGGRRDAVGVVDGVAPVLSEAVGDSEHVLE